MVVVTSGLSIEPPVGGLKWELGAAGDELSVAHVNAVTVTVRVEATGEGGGAVEQCHVLHRGSFPNGRAPYSTS